jgi:hypothetical protein
MAAGVWIGTGDNNYNGRMSEIGFMPNTSNLDDGSFNYETNKGVYNYQTDFNIDAKRYVPSEPTTLSEYKKVMDLAKIDGRIGILTNGFLPVQSLIGIKDD